MEQQLSAEDVGGKQVLEVGSYNVNGSARQIITALGPERYIGVDILRGPGVDQICPGEEVVSHYGPEAFDVVVVPKFSNMHGLGEA